MMLSSACREESFSVLVERLLRGLLMVPVVLLLILIYDHLTQRRFTVTLDINESHDNTRLACRYANRLES